MTFLQHPWTLVAALGLVTLLLAALLVRTRRKLRRARRDRRSQSTRLGQVAEQLAPLAGSYPYDAERFRFLGSPIDGVQFEDDRIVLVEFKTGRSDLTTRQRRIRDLVQDGRVEWRTLRIDA